MEKKLNLREVHLLEVEILKYFVSICQEYGLRYFLAGGTLLGAIRHKGFIPWDDDVDILMPRTDYDKFQGLVKQGVISHSRYIVKSLELGNLNYPFCKIFDLNTYIKKEWTTDATEKNLWIDILPLDGVPDSDIELSKLFRKSLFARKVLKVQKSNFGKADNFFKILIKPVVKFILLKTIGIQKTVEYIDKISRTYNFDDCDYIAGIAMGYGPQEKMKKEDYLNSVIVEFEGLQLKAPGCWDYYLKQLYGDYMVIPSENNRINHAIEVYYMEEI